MNQLKGELIAKIMEEYQKQQQQNIDELTEKLKSLNSVPATVDAELEENKLSNANKCAELEQLNALQEKVVKMEEYQKQQQQNIDELTEKLKSLNAAQEAKNAQQEKNIVDLQKTGLTPQNRWGSSAACHNQRTLSEPNRFIAQFAGKDKLLICSVHAAQLIPKNNPQFFCYYEVKILRVTRLDNVYIGLAPKQMQLNEFTAFYKGTFINEDNGTLRGQEVEGRLHYNRPLYEEGDVLASGFDLATRQIFHTRNGQRLAETTGWPVDFADDLFRTKIEANFWPSFEFKFR